MSLRSNGVKGAKWTLTSMVTLTMIQFIQLFLVANILGPEAVGILGMINLILLFGQMFADMGFANSLVHKQKVTLEQFSTIYWLNLFMGVSIFIIVLVSSPLAAVFFQESVLNTLIPITSFIFLLLAFGQPYQAILQKNLKFRAIALSEIIAIILSFSLVILLLYLDFGVIAIVYGQLLNAVIKGILLFVNGYNLQKLAFSFNVNNVRDLVSFGLYQMGERILNYITSNLDYLIIGRFLGTEALGYYNLAYNLIVVPITKINPVITKVGFPLLAKLQNERKKLKAGFLEITKITSLLNFPILIGVAAISPVAVPFFLGEEWKNSIALIQILSIVGIFRSIGNPVGALMMAVGQMKRLFLMNLWKVCIQFPFLIGGLWIGGANGVAVGFAISSFLTLFLNYFYLIKVVFGPSFKRFLFSVKNAFLYSVIVFLAIHLILYLNSDFLQVSNLYLLFICIFTGLIIYSSLFLKFEIQLLKKIFQK